MRPSLSVLPISKVEDIQDEARPHGESPQVGVLVRERRDRKIRRRVPYVGLQGLSSSVGIGLYVCKVS